MATHGGPGIIRDGLVLYLDAANPKSYPGNGVVWKDLSDSKHDAELVNGPLFSVENNGVFEFSGAGKKAQTALATKFQDFTVCVVFKDSNSSSWSRVVDKNYTDGFFISSQFQSYGKNYIGCGILEPNIPHGIALPYEPGKYNFFASTRKGVNHTIYLNGINEKASKTVSNSLLSNIPISLGAWSTNSSQPFKGNLSYVKIYNRALSEDEVLQNYNATKTRFSI